MAGINSQPVSPLKASFQTAIFKSLCRPAAGPGRARRALVDAIARSSRQTSLDAARLENQADPARRRHLRQRRNGRRARGARAPISSMIARRPGFGARLGGVSDCRWRELAMRSSESGELRAASLTRLRLLRVSDSTRASGMNFVRERRESHPGRAGHAPARNGSSPAAFSRGCSHPRMSHGTTRLPRLPIGLHLAVALVRHEQAIERKFG